MPKKIIFLKNNDQSNRKTHKSDLTPKILSIVAAVLLWFYVIDVQTTQHEKNFYSVPVTIENFNSETGLDIISGRESTVDVVLRGTKSQINSLLVSDIKASIDMSSVTDAGDYALDVSVETPSNVSLVKKSVSSVTVRVDKTIGKSVPVELDMTYLLPDAYEFGEISVTPKNVYISGPKDLIDTIEKGRVKLDIGNVKSSITSRSSVELVDKNRNVVTSAYVKLDNSFVEITVPVLKTVKKKVALDVTAKNVKYDYTITPSSVEIKGESNIVDGIAEVSTHPVSQVNAGVSSVRLSLPEEVNAYDLNGNLVTSVTVSFRNVEKEQKGDN